MTAEDPRRRPADNDEVSESFGIDEAADERPAPRSGAGLSEPVQTFGAPDAPGQEPTAVPDASPVPPVDATELRGDAAARSGGHRRRHAGKGRAKKERRKAPWWELPALVILAILIAILVKTFLVQPFYIPSESMEKTLHGCTGCSGDRILVNKIIYDFRDPHPGDIVVFNAPPGWDTGEQTSTPPSNPVVRAVRGFGQLIGFVPPDGLVLVKRVIAVGGQTVRGDRNGNVYISDTGPGGPYRKLHEPYVFDNGPSAIAKFGPITVPKGRLWVMGDHRNDSADSRFHCGPGASDAPQDVGRSCNVIAATVPDSAVIGKAFVIAWPPSRWRTLGTPSTFESAAAGITGTGVVPVAVVAPVFFVLRRRRRR